MDYLAPFLAQIGDPGHLSRAEAYKLKEECLQDLKQRLIDRANLIQARFEKVGSESWRALGLYTRKHFTSCSKSADKPSTSCVRTACPKLSTSLEQLVTSLMAISDL
jgi:hypothetical protein